MEKGKRSKGGGRGGGSRLGKEGRSRMKGKRGEKGRLREGEQG